MQADIDASVFRSLRELDGFADQHLVGCATRVAVQQDAVRVAAFRDTLQCRHAVQVLHDVANRRQIHVRLRQPFFDGRVAITPPSPTSWDNERLPSEARRSSDHRTG